MTNMEFFNSLIIIGLIIGLIAMFSTAYRQGKESRK